MKTVSDQKGIVPGNLICPPAAFTETSIAFVWDKPEQVSEIVEYQVYIDGELHGSSKSTDYTAFDLEPEKEYEVYVCALLTNGVLSQESNRILAATKPKSEVFDITSFGAVGDGKTINTKAIQAAIDACSYGGKVYVPKGSFVTGAIHLKSNMTLYLEDGGILSGSENALDYPVLQYRFEGLETSCYASLINAGVLGTGRLENIVIEGSGTIDASGSKLRKQEIAEKKGKPGRAICLQNVDNIYLKDITVRQSPAWCVHFIYCNHASLNHVEIHTKWDEEGNQYLDIQNGDGFDPDSSGDIYVFHSMIASQDDCIAIKSGRNEEGRRVGIPSRHIRITNCIFKSGFGVAVGSEMSGGVSDVLVQDCQFENTYSVGSVKAPRGRGGVIENIRYEDIIFKNHSLEHHDCEWFRGAVYIDQFYSHRSFEADKMEEVNEGTSLIRDITFKNITLDTYAGNAVYLTGLPERPLENIRLEHIQAVGKYGMKANNIKGLLMKEVSVVSREDEHYLYHNVEMADSGRLL